MGEEENVCVHVWFGYICKVFVVSKRGSGTLQLPVLKFSLDTLKMCKGRSISIADTTKKALHQVRGWRVPRERRKQGQSQGTPAKQQHFCGKW